MAQLGVVLEGYRDAVIIAVTDPRTGLQRRLKFPPTIAEVVEACETESVAMDTRARYAAMPKPNFQRFYALLPKDDRPGRRANLFVSSDAPQYQAAYEWAMQADQADWRWDKNRGGIWVNWWASPLGGMKCGAWNVLKAEVKQQREAAES